MDLPLRFLYSIRLAHFVTVYEYRNLRLAGESLGISQPALTKSIRHLEKQLDVVLFKRTSKGLKPTEAADVLHHHLERVTDLSRALEIELSALRGVGAGHINFGAGQMWSRLFVPEMVSQFQRQYPDTSLDITTGPMPRLVEELKSGQLDIVVGDLDGITVSDEFQVECVWCTEFWAFAGADHELSSMPAVTVNELVKGAWTGYVDGDVFARKVSAFCAEHDLQQPRISIRATNLANLLQLTRDSGNIAVLPKELATEASSLGLEPLRLDNPALWRINTGSIVETRKESISHYQALLRLVKEVVLIERSESS